MALVASKKKTVCFIEMHMRWFCLIELSTETENHYRVDPLFCIGAY